VAAPAAAASAVFVNGKLVERPDDNKQSRRPSRPRHHQGRSKGIDNCSEQTGNRLGPPLFRGGGPSVVRYPFMYLVVCPLIN